jgi:23S rRNA (cytosine1962-C5)-methyltransferase
VLRKRLGRAIRDGHPWLYADALDIPAGLTTGSIVDVVDPGGRVLGRGIYDAESPLAVRIWTLGNEALDEALVHARVAAALALRQAVIDPMETTAYRLLHGEGDLLPGIVCDVYGDTAVVQLDTPAVAEWLDTLVAAIHGQLPGIRRVLWKSGRRGAGVPSLRALVGEVPSKPLLVREHGMQLEVDVAQGHKTGLYLDQRENRQRVRALAAGRSVLNLCCYTGGFSVAAALGGAARTVNVDSAAPALAAAARNFAHNDIRLAPHTFTQADVFDYLAAGRETFDLVVLDPPSLAASRDALPGALAAYTRLNTLALAHLAPNGLLLTCSCSSHVTEAQLVDVVAAAGRANGRSVRLAGVYGAGPDHPTLAAFPEGHYLKAVLAFVP